MFRMREGVIPLSIVLFGWYAVDQVNWGVWRKIQSLNCGSKHFIMKELSTKGMCHPGCMLKILKHNVKAMGSVLMEFMN